MGENINKRAPGTRERRSVWFCTFDQESLRERRRRRIPLAGEQVLQACPDVNRSDPSSVAVCERWDGV